MPGTTSCLMRNAGMKNEWMTSCDAMISRTAGPSGMCSSLISRWPPRCCTFHIHCLADDVDRQRIVRRVLQIDEKLRTPDEQAEEGHQGRGGPRHLPVQLFLMRWSRSASALPAR